MIKRIQFLHTLQEEPARTGTPPLRAAICRVVRDVEAAAAATPYAAISMEWFDDLAALRGDAGHDVIIAEEHILRGADWLERRWLDGRAKYKHMALARRAACLSTAAFSERWRNRPGRLGSGAGAPARDIPAAARGLAYVQNHPVPGSNARYDAINEVYFDDIASMQSRLAFFAEHNAAQADADLVSEAHFVIVEEELLLP